MTKPPVGYSGKPLIDKLGLKPGRACVLVAPSGAPGRTYRDLIDPLPDGAKVKTALDAKASIIHLFVVDTAALRSKIKATVAALPLGAALWISWPKKSSKLFVDLTEDGIRSIVLPTGWVDVKVAAVDEDFLVRTEVPEAKDVKLGILETGSPPGGLEKEFGDYPCCMPPVALSAARRGVRGAIDIALLDVQKNAFPTTPGGACRRLSRHRLGRRGVYDPELHGSRRW